MGSRMTVPTDQSIALLRLAARISDGQRNHYEFLRDLFGMLGDKWAVLVLLVLETGELRHAELRRSLDRTLEFEQISQRILTMRLRAFEEAGILEREVTPDVPPKVTYRLTDRGRALAGHAWQIIELFS